MTRPAVIIGLGGTGQQAVLWLKKDRERKAAGGGAVAGV